MLTSFECASSCSATALRVKGRAEPATYLGPLIPPREASPGACSYRGLQRTSIGLERSASSGGK
jgi:hypothetical protein